VTLSATEKNQLADFLLELETGVVVPPAAPTNVTVTVGSGNGSLVITWTDTSNNEQVFHVQRRVVGTTTWTTASANIPANSTSFTDTNLPASTTFEYRVRAENGALGSTWIQTSNNATTPAPAQITVLDNTSPGVTMPAGAWTLATGTGFVGADYHTGTAGAATYAPSLPQGQYEIEVKFATGWSQLRAGVPHTVNHANGSSDFAVDQTQGDVWVKLGTSFTLNPSSSVVIGRPSTGRPSWDAVRFTRLATTVAPTIAPENQPRAAAVDAGQPVTFTVVASGTAPFTYQWLRNGQAITGANSASYTIAATTTADAGNFSVRINNSAGQIESNSVALTVRAPADLTPSISTAATLPSGTVGQAFSLTLAATGGDGALTWSATSLPAWLTLNSTTGALAGTPPISGSFAFIATVTDADGDSANRTFTHVVAPASGSGDGPWLEAGGTVTIEAESATVLARGDAISWSSSTADGVTFMATPAGGAPFATWDAAAELSFPFTITTPGTYSVAVRRRSVDGNSDSAYLGLNGTQVGANQFTLVSTSFAWTGGVSLGELAAGNHTLSIRRREAGWQVDRILITRIGSVLPGAGAVVVGPAASSRGPGGPGAEPVGFQRWRHLHFTPAQLAAPDHSGASAAPAGDGVPNKLKYALGFAPLTRVDQVLTRAANQSDGRVSFQFQRLRNNPEDPLLIEVSSDLLTWSSDPASRSESILEARGDSDLVSVSPPSGSSSSRWFVRLRVE
jgi:hypothetical protein